MEASSPGVGCYSSAGKKSGSAGAAVLQAGHQQAAPGEPQGETVFMRAVKRGSHGKLLVSVPVHWVSLQMLSPPQALLLFTCLHTSAPVAKSVTLIFCAGSEDEV